MVIQWILRNIYKKITVYYPFDLVRSIILLFKKHDLYIELTMLSLYRYGRVNYVLARRLELLREVARLQESLDVPGDVSYTCETAGHFYLYQVGL